MPHPPLPESIRTHLQDLFIHRQGTTPAAYMKTLKLEGYVVPGKQYKVEWKQLKQVTLTAEPPKTPTIPPPHCTLQGHWDTTPTTTAASDNVLGKNGTLLLATEEVSIPVAPPTPSHFSYYGAQLLKVGEVVAFGGQQPIPLLLMEIGHHYAEGYLLQKALGGGCYLEYHDTPHFHMPLSPLASGYLLLGKHDKGRYLLSALPIPYGHAVYTPPGVVHCDGFLVGRYRVGYTITTHYSTVFLRTQGKEVVRVKVV